MTKKCWIFLPGLLVVCGCARVKVMPIDHEGAYAMASVFIDPILISKSI